MRVDLGEIRRDIEFSAAFGIDADRRQGDNNTLKLGAGMPKLGIECLWL